MDKKKAKKKLLNKPVKRTISKITNRKKIRIKKEYKKPAKKEKKVRAVKKKKAIALIKAEENPIIVPKPENKWEAWQTFNPGVILLKDKIYFLYRAIGEDGISRLGYAVSNDGFTIDERLSYPVYEHPLTTPAINYYSFASGGSFGGTEDPRIVRVDEEGTLYMTYTACDEGLRVALTSIKVEDFLQRRWKWKAPKLISPPNETHKNWVIFPEKIKIQTAENFYERNPNYPEQRPQPPRKKFLDWLFYNRLPAPSPLREAQDIQLTRQTTKNKYAILHSINPKTSVAYRDTLEFKEGECIQSYYNGNNRRKNCWDSFVRGVGAPPIKTKHGWLLFYHAIDEKDTGKYKVGTMLLDLEDPTKTLHRSQEPVLEPEEEYENNGFKAGVVYVSGAVIKNGELLVYYGASDSYVGVAHANLEEFLETLIKGAKPKLKTKTFLRKK